MSCSNGCGNTAPTITCLPNPGTTGCLDYISTDCVQFLGASNTIGFGILQNDNLTTIITKISGATVAPNVWVNVTLSSPSATTASGFTAQVTKDYKGTVRFAGIVQVSAATSILPISNLSSTYFPVTPKAFTVTYSGSPYLVIITSTGAITIQVLTSSSIGVMLIDFSKFWYDSTI
jgi:hypothetical protein